MLQVTSYIVIVIVIVQVQVNYVRSTNS
jgi:hypothetical protein